jgi:hypothetical protein
MPESQQPELPVYNPRERGPPTLGEQEKHNGTPYGGLVIDEPASIRIPPDGKHSTAAAPSRRKSPMRRSAAYGKQREFSKIKPTNRARLGGVVAFVNKGTT